MDVLKIENDSYDLGICKCCLMEGCVKNMWGEYLWEGEIEVYGEMLTECFALSWQQPGDSTEHIEQICDMCISRLRDAYHFKLQVLSSEHQLLGSYENGSIVNEDGEIITYVMEEANEIKIECQSENEEMYEEVEYLEDDENAPKEEEYIGLIVTDEPAQALKEEPKQNEEPEQPKRKWPKKKKKSERLKSYRQYTEDDLRKSLEAVRSKRMSPSEAAKYYNVPRKTISAKLCYEKNKKKEEPTPEDEMKLFNKEKQYKFIEEIKTILTYTNATPYKTNAARYFCAYCSTEGPNFEDPDDLRTHTRTKHAAERTKNIDQIMRPHWLNEIIKLDIENLYCTICCTVISKWNDMFKHFKEKHDIVLDEAYTRVIPYILKNELVCALCRESFPNYHHLDGHMNAHYNNYICYECGDSFLALNRLKKHVMCHNTGRFPCNVCNKVFTLEKYRKKHIDLVHKLEPKMRCLYCPEKFHGNYPRHLHVIECHNEKVKYITCELCGQTFDWKPYYLSHIRRKHKKEKNYKCKYCNMQFFMIGELKRHEVTHTGEKNFECTHCHKKYSTSWALKQHVKTHGEMPVVKFRLKRNYHDISVESK